MVEHEVVILLQEQVAGIGRESAVPGARYLPAAILRLVELAVAHSIGQRGAQQSFQKVMSRAGHGNAEYVSHLVNLPGEPGTGRGSSLSRVSTWTASEQERFGAVRG